MSPVTLQDEVLPAPAARAERVPSVLLRQVSWRGYITLLEEIGDGAARLTYDNGFLEIEVPSELHERLKKLVGALAEAALEAAGTDFEPFGSTTWKREESLKGIEADECYYVASLSAVRGKPKVELGVDPPPDLAIEAEVTLPAVAKLPVYAALGVGEVWRVSESGELRFLRLTAEGVYEPTARSAVIPVLAADQLTAYVKCLRPLGSEVHSEVVRRFRAWIRSVPADVGGPTP